MCKICIARGIDVDLFPWCGANFGLSQGNNRWRSVLWIPRIEASALKRHWQVSRHIIFVMESKIGYNEMEIQYNIMITCNIIQWILWQFSRHIIFIMESKIGYGEIQYNITCNIIQWILWQFSRHIIFIMESKIGYGEIQYNITCNIIQWILWQFSRHIIFIMESKIRYGEIEILLVTPCLFMQYRKIPKDGCCITWGQMWYGTHP